MSSGVRTATFPGAAWVRNSRVCKAEPTTPEAPATRSQRRDAERGGRRRRRSAGGSILRETAIILVSALVLSWLIKTLLVQAFFIPSSSMHDTLVEDDRIMVSKLTPGPFDLERGDIIVFKDPGGWLEGQEPVEATGWRGAMNDLFTFVGLYPQDAGEHPHAGSHIPQRCLGVGDDLHVLHEGTHREPGRVAGATGRRQDVVGTGGVVAE